MQRKLLPRVLSALVVAAFVTLAFGSGNGNVDTVSDPAPAAPGTTAPSAPAPPPPPEPEPEPTLTLHQSFDVGSFSYEITEVSTASRLGSRFVREEPAAGALFLVVNYTETNNGTETHTGAGSPIRFRDSQGRTYQTSSRAQTAILMSQRSRRGGGGLLPQLQPGIAHEGVTAFEIPESSASGVGTLVVSERGLLGNATREVQFNFAGGE